MAAEMALPNTACLQFEVLLADYFDSRLSSADVRRAEEHMEQCAACREAFENAQLSARVFRAAAPPLAAPDAGFPRMVMARVRVAESEMSAERAGFWQSLVTLGWRFAATAALALVVLVAYDAGSTHHSQPNALTVRPIQTTDFLFASDPAQPPQNRDEVLLMVAENGHGSH